MVSSKYGTPVLKRWKQLRQRWYAANYPSTEQLNVQSKNNEQCKSKPDVSKSILLLARNQLTASALILVAGISLANAAYNETLDVAIDADVRIAILKSVTATIIHPDASRRWPVVDGKRAGDSARGGSVAGPVQPAEAADAVVVGAVWDRAKRKQRVFERTREERTVCEH